MSASIPEAIPYLGEADFKTRDEAKALLADMQGIRIPKTWVPRGESLLPIGEQKLRGIRAEYAALPMLGVGLNSYAARLLSEHALDSKVRIQDVRMDGSRGGLLAPGLPESNALAYSKAGFAHVASFVRPSSIRNGFSENLLAMPVSMRAQWFNECAQNAHRGDSDKVVIRTVLAPGEDGLRRTVRAVTSQKHSLATGDDKEIVSALRRMDNTLKGAKIRVTRDGLGDASWFEVIWPAVDRQIRVGDSLAFGLRFKNSETKGGALVVEPFLFDAICYNLTTAYSTVDEDAFTLRHVGDLSRKLGSIILKAQRVIDPFVRMFADAYKTPFPNTMPTRGDVLQSIGKALELPESTLTLAQNLWNADGSSSAGDTLAGAANALTRASQEQTMDDADKTEKAAGKLIAEGWGALA